VKGGEMAFTCEFCHKPQPSGTKPVMIVSQVIMVIREIVQTGDVETHNLRVYSQIEYKTVKEKQACPRCAKVQRIRAPEVVEVIDQSNLADFKPP
jgi:hypothetical protein